MGFPAKVALETVLLVLVSSFYELNGAEFLECREQCGGRQAEWEAHDKGEVLCVTTQGLHFSYTPCQLNCQGKSPDEDQLKCWKGMCIRKTYWFCEKPGMPNIKPDQCEEFLIAGKAKYYGNASADEEEMKHENH